MGSLNDSDREYLAKVYTYHPPSQSQIRKYQLIREAGKMLAETVLRNCPDSVERGNATDRIEETIMWANAAIARNEPMETHDVRQSE